MFSKHNAFAPSTRDMQMGQVRRANTLARTMEMELVVIIVGRKRPMTTIIGGCVHVLKPRGNKTSAPCGDRKEATDKNQLWLWSNKVIIRLS